MMWILMWMMLVLSPANAGPMSLASADLDASQDAEQVIDLGASALDDTTQEVVPADWWEDEYDCCDDCFDAHRAMGLDKKWDAWCCQGFCVDTSYFCPTFPVCSSPTGGTSGGGPFTGPIIVGPWP